MRVSLFFLALVLVACAAVELIQAPNKADSAGLSYKSVTVDTDREKGIKCILTTITNPVGFLHVFTPGDSCEKRVQTSKTARENNCKYAINAGPFNMDNGQCEGSIVSNGKTQQLAADGSGYAMFGMTSDGKYLFGSANSTEVASYGVTELVSGFVQGLLVDNSVPASSTDAEVAQRQALGIDKEANLLILTVDGAEFQDKGMTMAELSVAFANLGAVTAINLDGGGSTTTWENGKGTRGFVNHPTCSDNVWPECERRVASVVCIM